MAASVPCKHREHAQHQCQSLGVEGGVEEASAAEPQEHLHHHGVCKAQIGPEGVGEVVDVHREDDYPYDDEGRVGLLVFGLQCHGTLQVDELFYPPDVIHPFHVPLTAEQVEHGIVCHVGELG